jgi:hypothetical protein
MFCRFSGSFEPLFDPNCRGNINFRILPLQFGSKGGQNNPEKRRTINFERGLLIGTAKAALVIGALYAANHAFKSPARASSMPALVQGKVDCENLFAKGFEGRVACNKFGWESVSVPGMDSSKYSLILDETCDHDCTAVLTEAGQKLIPLSKNCHEAWKILGNRVTLWWDYGAMQWY